MKHIFTIFSLAFSLNISAQWVQINKGISSIPDLGALLLGSSNNCIFSLANTGYRSTDNGNNWEAITYPGGIPVVGYNASERFLLGMNASTACIFYTTDNGNTWKASEGTPSATVVTGFFADASNIYAHTSSKGIYKSTDKGLTWKEANTGLVNQNITSMTSINSKLFASTMGGIYVSSNNGETWSAANTGIDSWDNSGKAIWTMNDKLYFTGQGGGFYTSANEAASWTNWATRPSVFGLGLNELIKKGNTIYIESRHFAGGLRDSIFVSNDQGTSWQNITGNLAANNLGAAYLTEHNGLLFISYTQSKELGIYRRELPTSLSNKELSSATIKLFPNPSSNTINVESDEIKKGLKYSLIDYFGKRIFNSEFKSDFGEMIDISTLETGFYYLKLEFNKPIYLKVVKN